MSLEELALVAAKSRYASIFREYPELTWETASLEIQDKLVSSAKTYLELVLPLYKASVLQEAADQYGKHPELSTTWGDVAADLRDDACEASGVCLCEGR